MVGGISIELGNGDTFPIAAGSTLVSGASSPELFPEATSKTLFVPEIRNFPAIGLDLGFRHVDLRYAESCQQLQ